MAIIIVIAIAMAIAIAIAITRLYSASSGRTQMGDASMVRVAILHMENAS